MPSPGVPFSVMLTETGFTATQSVYFLGTERRVLGLLRLEEERLVLQLTETRKIIEVTASGGYQERMEADQATERAVPLAHLGGVRLRRRWLAFELQLSANDLRAFAGLPGAWGVELRLRVARQHHALARELVGALRLRLADLAVRGAEAARSLSR